MLWEVLGLGAGSLPLTLRFSPMIGGVLYWLRPGTTRLPPWPERVPVTRGTTRTSSTSASTRALLGGGALPAARRRGRRDSGSAVGTAAARPGRGRGRCWRCSAALGLRDKVPFLAARAEIYGNLMLIFLFPLTNMVVAAQLVFFCIWWGAAVLEAEPPLPLRGHGDDQQHALEPLAGGEAPALPRPPRGPAALRDRAPRPPTSAR